MSELQKYNYNQIAKLLPEHKVVGDKEAISFDNIKTISGADENSLVFIAKGSNDKSGLVGLTKSCQVIIDNTDGLSEEQIQKKIFIVVKEPKMAFSIIGNEFFTKKIEYSIHSSAVIHKEAIISNNVFIGPNCVIGKGTIEEGTIIYGNVYIFDNFHIGKNVKISPGIVIGAEGFGYNNDEKGIPVQFPHVGGVVIEDNVEIGSNTSIDRGALSDTIIKNGAKIDNLVHIAHNVIIDECAYVIANSMIAGSTKIGKNAYIAPSVSVRDQIEIGDNSFIGMGATALKDIPNDEIWIGNPARKLPNK